VGPLLRYADAHRATVWVETDGACTVEVLGHRERTFCVEGHHFALVVVDGLEPGVAHPYEVHLDGARVWPEVGSPLPPSTIRTTDPDRPFRLVFGSCRVTGPHEALPTSTRGFGRRAADVDALRAYALRMRDRPEAELPDALLLLGDQVYADEVSPGTEEFTQSRRGPHRSRDEAPLSGVADFEEYTHLYREAWSDPLVRWVLSTVPTAMVFDDHDVYDDWNTSAAWVASMRRKAWWHDRIVGGLMAYWLYQHLGNLSPDDLAENQLLRQVREAGDGGSLVRVFAERADRESAGTRWSYARDLGRSRLVVIDSRCGRVLEGERRMVDDEEFDWIAEQLDAEVDHLVLATSLPFLLPPSLHDLEAWDEAVAAGRWGGLAARAGEWLRQAADLEHWAAFQASFRRLAALLAEVRARPRAPATVVMLSGDVHHAYLAEASFPGAQAGSAVYQAVSSPLRHPMPSPLRWLYRAAISAPAQRVARRLAASAGLAPAPIAWRLTEGPRFENQIATLRFAGREARLELELAHLDGAGQPALAPMFARDLASASGPRRRAPGAEADPAGRS